jgi:hypothetical protein
VEGGVMDIVERLQGMSMMKAMTWVTADKSKRPANIYSEAADEIERLREALQLIVDEKCDYMTRNQLGDPVARSALQQKFAELIVRECATAFEAEVDTWKEMNPYQGSIKRQGTKAIKKHFGVE